MVEKDDTQKIGSGHAAAMWRQGLAELRAAIYPESNVAQPSELGLYGRATPGEIAEARRSDGREANEEPSSTLADRIQEAESRADDRDREPPEPERG
jgi:hypothetical protein